jgi:phage terminase small subunit
MTPRQQAFAAQYAIDHCGTRAAVRAGYAKAGAHVAASRLLRKAKVAAMVADHEAEAAIQLRVTRESVLAEAQEAVALARQKGDVAGMISGLKLICQM